VKLKWRLDKREITRDVKPPATVDLDRLCSGVNEVLAHLDGRDRRQWPYVQKLAQSKTFCEMPSALRNLAKVDGDGPRLLSLADGMDELRARANFEARFDGKRGYRMRLYASVIRAWTTAGGALGASQSGPLQRFLCLLAKKLNFELSPRGAKDVIERERKRRHHLDKLNRRWGSQGK
jgi:hypothetical protein